MDIHRLKLQEEFSDYWNACLFFKCIKIMHGATFLNTTLLKHPKLTKKLVDFEKKYIIDLEREILNSES